MEKTVNVARKNLILAAGALLVAAAVHATSIVPPENLGELARISEAVVLAQAGAPRVSQRGIQAFTLTTFRVLVVVSGELERGDRITVEAPGGELDGYLWFVPGSPRFAPGQVYLLFLSQKPTGEWLPRTMAYGLLRRVHGRDGSSLLAPLPEETGIQPFPRPDGILPEPVETYRETALLPHLRAVATGRDVWDSRKVLARSDQIPFEAQAQAIPAGCAYMSQGNSFRWQAFDLGQSATMSADSAGDSSLTGGGFAQVQGALSDWMGVPSTSMQLVYGGTGAYTMPCTVGQDYPSNDIVVFNDPCSDIPDLSGCAGTLGYGGVGASGSHAFDGMTWWTVNHWYMVVNNGAGCLGATYYQRMLAHELGHGLGFDHVSDPSALMYYMCCNTINSTDTTCAQYLYPAAGPPGPTPSPTPTRTPTPPPGGLTASFAFAPSAPFAGATVRFTDTSIGATTWTWTFGDGSQSSVRNPSHTYAARGTYTATLRVSNGVGSSQTTKSVTVGARARRNFSGR
jgi:PKD repeat protein